MTGEMGPVPVEKRSIASKLSLDRGWRSDLFWILLILLMVCLFFWKVVVHPEWIIFSEHSDIIEQYYPWRIVAAAPQNEGALPFWNPFNYGGEPLLANMQLGFFYPINIFLFWLLPTHSAFGFGLMLHIFIAGASIYLVGRRVGLGGMASFISSMVFIFGGYFAGHVYSGHYVQVSSASWIPMIYLTFDHCLKRKSWRWGALMGLLVGMQLLAGHIQIVLFSAILLLFSFIYHIYWHRKEMKTFSIWGRTISGPVVGGMFSLLAASIQIIPTYIFTQNSTRSGGMSYLWATDYSLPPWYFITLLAPRFFGTPLQDNYLHPWNYWELSIYVGIPALALIVLSYRYWKVRYVRFFSGLGIFSILMALGMFTPLYWIFWKFVPGFDILRVPSRFYLLTLFSVSILAGFGFRSLMRDIGIKQRKRLQKWSGHLIRATAVGLPTIIILILFKSPISYLIAEFIKEVIADGRKAEMQISMIGSVFNTAVLDMLLFLLLLGGVIGILIWRSRTRKCPEYLGIVLASFLVLNLAVYHMPFVDTKDTEDIYTIEPHISFLIENADGYRVYDPDEVITSNYQIIYGIETLKGYNPLELLYYSELLGTARNLSHNGKHPIMDLLGVRYILSRNRLIDSGMDLVYTSYNGKQVFIYENPSALPRVFIVENFTVLSDGKVLDELRKDGFDPLSSVLIGSIPDPRGVHGMQYSGPSTLDLSATLYNRIDLKATLPEKGFLVIGESYYPSWDVIVDGERYEVERVYHGLMGVYLNTGVHDVSFVYDRYP
ncbi:MAG: hypothetical protein ACMUFK_02840 [Thermoplasmatota archaeon]